MLIEFETKGARVKGLTFHPERPWILASLHSGVIQLWDYSTETLIYTFDEHKGPVRGVHFHSSQPLFVSGGDDHKIKVWNYETGSCLFTLLGHFDYIRTVQFHHKNPWIVSASDDKTIRIWNWESQTCISTLTDHKHFVMCASFHPKDDLLVSASHDKTVRVWHIDSGLSGEVNVIAKYVLRGHTKGVNWASFHPTFPLIVSGAEDHLVKLWRMSETEDWEVDTLEGHMKSVSSVMFHAKQGIIVSNSKDKSIRVWDATTQTEIETFPHDHKFWILAVHPEIDLLATGHDNGVIVFKLEREPPAFALSGDSLFYAKDGYLQYYKYSTQKDSQVIPIQRPGTRSLNQSPRTLSYSPTENAVLICSDLDGGSYELFIIPKDSVGSSHSRTGQDAKRGTGGSAVFITPTLFAVLEKSTKQVLLKDIKNTLVKKRSLPILTDAIFCAGTGNLLCSSKDEVFIFKFQNSRVLGKLRTPSVRYVVWTNDMESVALLSKDTIIIASKTLVLQYKHQEKMRVKSGAWDDNGGFIYTTLTHIKYWRPNEDSRIIQTLEVPVYITKVSGNTIFCLDRDGKNRAIPINHDKAEVEDNVVETTNSSASSSSKLKKKRKGEAVEGGAATKKRSIRPTRTNVWWDLENIPVPKDFSADKVYEYIVKNLTDKGFTGPVKVTVVVAYEDSFVPKGLQNNKNITIDVVRNYDRSPDSKNNQVADHGIEDRINHWLEEGHPPQNVMIMSGDQGFRSLFDKLKTAGHTPMAVFRKIEGQHSYSTEIRESVNIFWDDWRSFLGLPSKEVAKAMKAAEIAAKKKKKTKEKNRKANLKKKLKRRAKKKGGLGSAASGGAVLDSDVN